jgi:hypothetical protein
VLLPPSVALARSPARPLRFTARPPLLPARPLRPFVHPPRSTAQPPHPTARPRRRSAHPSLPGATPDLSVTKIVHYFRFYPETLDVQRIAFVGALLTDEAEEWHQAWDEIITLANGQDTWAVYSKAIRKEYVDPREGATAHAKLKALKYKGDMKVYLTAFKALNLQAGSNGEGLQDIIDRVLPNNIIDVRFYQNPQDLRTDEDFLTTTYEAGWHVEKLVALKARKADNSGSSAGTTGKEGQSSR